LTFRLVLAYDGTDFRGWQIQLAARTVQGMLIGAARRLDPHARVTGASRTDAGVHALRQTASLRTGTALSSDAILRALNALLPGDVRVLQVREAAAGFDARRAATGKRYAYLIDNGAVASPLLARYAWHVPRTLDVEAMRGALAHLRGLHDFGAFCAAPGRAKDPRCRVRALHVVRRRERVVVLLSADRFLHHMARNIVGSAVAVGRGARDPAWLAAVLAARDRRLAGPTAPAHGLALVRVLYPR
jgi:tRNA pseudouridine38-40 synthase